MARKGWPRLKADRLVSASRLRFRSYEGDKQLMHGWMTAFGLLAIGGASGASFEAGKLAFVIFGALFLVAWLSRAAGRRAW